MIYKEYVGNLFNYNNYTYVQCISADFKMGAGISLEFNKRFNIKNDLINKYNNALKLWEQQLNKGMCVYCNNVLNLITKKYYYHKPTYNNMYNALVQMKNLILQKNINKIAMPTIGCGLDKLEWNKIKAMLFNIYRDMNIEIIVIKTS